MIRPPPRSTLFPSTPLFRPHQLVRVDRAPHLRGSGLPGEHLPLEHAPLAVVARLVAVDAEASGEPLRSEEHTSELQSRQYLVCRLLLEKKKHKVKRSKEMSL